MGACNSKGSNTKAKTTKSSKSKKKALKSKPVEKNHNPKIKEQTLKGEKQKSNNDREKLKAALRDVEDVGEEAQVKGIKDVDCIRASKNVNINQQSEPLVLD